MNKYTTAEKILLILMALLGGMSLFYAYNKGSNSASVQHDTCYEFGMGMLKNIKPTNKIKASADSVEVKNIYLVPRGTWEKFAASDWPVLIEQVLKPATSASPKVMGKGNFASCKANPADSAWLTQHGWSVNAQ